MGKYCRDIHVQNVKASGYDGWYHTWPLPQSTELPNVTDHPFRELSTITPQI